MNLSKIIDVLKLGSIVLVALILLSCVATQPQIISHFCKGPGFWLGLWHGFIAPLTFIISLFSDSIRIYAYPNAGRWYDLGFMLGIGGFSGGIFAGARHNKHRN